MKEWLLTLIVLLLVWSNRDNLVPAEYQFWKKNQTAIKVHNNSDRDLADVIVYVWAKPEFLGLIKKGEFKDLKVRRHRDLTEVVIDFKYGADHVNRHLGILDESADYTMTIYVNFAGVVTTQTGTVATGVPSAVP